MMIMKCCFFLSFKLRVILKDKPQNDIFQVNVTYKRLRRSFISIVVIVILILSIQNAACSQAQDKMSQTLVNKNMFSVEGANFDCEGNPVSQFCSIYNSYGTFKIQTWRIRIYFSCYYLASDIQNNTHEQPACNLAKFIQECRKYISFNHVSSLPVVSATHHNQTPPIACIAFSPIRVFTVSLVQLSSNGSGIPIGSKGRIRHASLLCGEQRYCLFQLLSQLKGILISSSVSSVILLNQSFARPDEQDFRIESLLMQLS